MVGSSYLYNTHSERVLLQKWNIQGHQIARPQMSPKHCACRKTVIFSFFPSFFFPFPILQFPFLAFAFNDLLFWSYLFVVPFCDALSFAFSSRYFLWVFISFLCLSFLQLFFSFLFFSYFSLLLSLFLSLTGFFAALFLDTLRIGSLPTKFPLYLYQLRCVWFSLWSTIQVCGWCAMNLLPPTSVFCRA